MSSLAIIEETNPEHAHHPLAEVAPTAIQLMLTLEEAGLITPRSLTLPDGIEYEPAAALGAFLGELKSRGNFYLGDWLLEVEQRLPEQFSQLAELTGLSEQTNLRIMDVCRKVPTGRRREELTWSCHAAVANLPAREQRAWLTKAVNQNWGYKELRREMQAARTEEKPQLFDGPGDGEADGVLLLEAARALVAHAEEAGENVIVRREDYARLRAALGEE